jgi:transcriptional regulator
MYLPSHFKEDDISVIHELIRAYPLGTVVIHGREGLAADHLPFMLDSNSAGPGILRAHVARANRLWQQALSGDVDALAIFQGPSAYVSPSSYETKAQTHRVVPTYNYAVVHAYGRIEVKDDEKWLRGLVARLTHDFESREDRPWRMGDAPADFIADQLRHIVGIEIKISRLEGKWKMSQNRSEADQRGVIRALGARGSEEACAVAAEIERRIDHS